MIKEGRVAFLLFVIHNHFLSISVLSQIVQHAYIRKITLDNRISNETIPMVITNGQIHCAQCCNVRDDCVSFFYLMSAGHCKLLNHLVESDMSTRSEYGWKHYVQEGHATIYNVTVKTGNIRYAGTNANVFIQCFGISGMHTERLFMDDEGKHFGRRNMKEFELVDVNVGPIAYIVVGHDNSGIQPSWFLDYIRVKRPIDENEISTYMATATSSLRKPKYEEYFFPCYRWFGVNKEDGLIIRNLTYNSTQVIFE